MIVPKLTLNEQRVSPMNCARLFLLHKMDTAALGAALLIPEAQAARLLTRGLDDPRSDRFRTVKRFGT